MVLEDLERKLKKSYVSNQEFDGIKYNDLFSLLRLYDIKNVVKRMSKNYGVTVSLTSPEYTSQQCNRCGYISRDNRKSQEEFKCIKCNHEENADLNASKNIRDRINVNVLRNALHKLEVGKNNTFLPKFNNKFKIKEEYLKSLLQI